MSRTERLLLDVANLLVVGTGVVYAWMKYMMESADEWAVVNHPWQPHVQHLHVLAAPLLVFVGGVFWKHHVLKRYRDNGSGGRWTGLALALQFIPMVLSGYLIQISVSEAWRTTWVWVHLITSGLWVVMALAHRVRVSGGEED
jgi:hypothetical protein